MAEFERWGELSDAASSHFPADFTPEDVATAQWLNTLYDIDGEQLPPRYAQTLLGDPQHAIASEDFEERTLDAVFAKLALTRPRPATRPLPRVRLFDRAALLAQRVGRQVAFGMMALAMLLSYNALGTSAAFASVLQLVTGHGGAQSVKTYPQAIPATTSAAAASPTLAFTPTWPGRVTHGYVLTGVDMLKGQNWTEGPMVALHYELQDNHGVHHLTFLEFMPRGHLALQVVQDGAAAAVDIGPNKGIFVWGQWVRLPQRPTVWQPSQRAELIYGDTATHSPVIWLAADALDGSTKASLQATMVQVATSLVPYLPLVRGSNHHVDAAVSTATLNQLFGNDVIALVPVSSATDAPEVFVQVGPITDQAVTDATGRAS